MNNEMTQEEFKIKIKKAVHRLKEENKKNNTKCEWVLDDKSIKNPPENPLELLHLMYEYRMKDNGLL